MFPTMKVNVTSPNLAVLHADWRLHQHFGVGIIAIAPLSGKLLERPYAETKMNDACVIPNKAPFQYTISFSNQTSISWWEFSACRWQVRSFSPFLSSNLSRKCSLERVAKLQKMSMGQVAVSWVLNKKGDSYTIHPSSGNLTVSRAAITATIISSPDLNIVLDHIGA